MQERMERLLDAAIEVLAAGGVRQLTHRAVDARAGLPMGSASNRFRTRDALLVGVLERLLDRETAAWARLTADADSADLDEFSTALGRLVEQLSDELRELTLARHAVFVEARSRPQLRQGIDVARTEVATWAAPLLRALGSSDPVAHLGHLLALVDGLLVSQLTHPSPDFDPTAAIRALLRGLVDAPTG